MNKILRQESIRTRTGALAMASAVHRQESGAWNPAAATVEQLETRLCLTATSFAAGVHYGPSSNVGEVLQAIDVNGDKAPDVVVNTNADGTVQALLNKNDGSGVLETPPVQAPAPAPELHDFNGDGVLDQAVITGDSITIMLGKAGGGFSAGQVITLQPGEHAASVVVADFDGDGTLDLAVNTFDGSSTGGPADHVLVFPGLSLNGKPTGAFGAPLTVSTGGDPEGLAVGDFNKDGRPDLVASNFATKVAVLLNTTPKNGALSFAPAVLYSASAGFDLTRVVVADFNGDGNPDIAALDQNGSVTLGANGVIVVFDGNGGGTFADGLPFYLPSGSAVSTRIATADFNHDGKPDLVTSDDHDQTVDVFLNNTPSPTSASGPVALYHFDQSGGATTTDSSGNNNAGTLAGGPAFAPGEAGNALKLNGAKQDVLVPNSPSLNPTTAITLSSWINVTDWNGNRRILQKGANDNQYRLLAEFGLLKFDLSGVGTVFASLPSTNAWHLITGTYDGSHMILYVDGKQVAVRAASGSIPATSDPLLIGAKNAAGATSGDFFKGLLDETVIYDRALSASEITSILLLGPGLNAGYGFNETSGVSAADSSGNGNTATLNGGATFSPAPDGNALSLNGNKQYATVANSPSVNPTTAITLSAWINVGDWNGNRRILQKGANDNQYRLLGEFGLLKFDLSGVGVVFAALPSTNTWHLITGTYDGSHMTLYIDGKAVSTRAASGSIHTTADPLLIGAKNTAGLTFGDFFKGLIDDTRIYGRGLSASDVAALFAAG